MFYPSSNCVISSVGNPESSMHTIALQDNLFYMYACVSPMHDIRKGEENKRKARYIYVDVLFVDQICM